ncbi:PqiB family protein [Aquincola tertiaricarbonis]|uniref:PqiB family protein n=1 Tax=Aquincola tertiaricarbonis TaxID=391953 RepID=UPI000614EF50|nr:MlaD family protein [Aquincola tertiaricarbonis]
MQPDESPDTPARPPAAPLPASIPDAVPAPRRRWSMAQAIWLVPLVAVLAVGWLAASEWLQRGPSITIRFATGEGIEAGKTRIKYRNVDVGQVSAVRLAPDLKGVLVTAQMERNAAPLLVDDTRFWVVRARVAGGEVSGLTTLLSGAYIGVDGGKSEETRRSFTGLETQPVVSVDEAGKEFVLQASSLGSLEIGSAVYFRRVRVGQVLSADLSPDGQGLRLRVFVRAPYDRFVSSNARFWHASGVDVSFDASTGLRLRTESLLSVLVGGVAFETPAELDASTPAEAGTTFNLFEGQAAALRRGAAQVLEYTAVFTDSVRGLAVGAPVEFKGFVIGEVASLGIRFDREGGGFAFPVKLHIYRDTAATVAAREATARRTDDGNGARFPIERLLSGRSVDRGLRAQLRSANLLTGQRYVAIDFFPEHRGEKVAGLSEGQREIPTVQDAFGELQAQVARIAKRLEEVPFEKLAGDMSKALVGIEGAARSVETTMGGLQGEVVPSVRQTLDEVRGAVKDVRGLLAQDAPLPQDVRGAMQDLSRAADAIRQLADTLERQPESLLRGKRETELEPAR